MRIEKGHEEANVVDKKRGANICKRGAYITSRVYIHESQIFFIVISPSLSSHADRGHIHTLLAHQFSACIFLPLTPYMITSVRNTLLYLHSTFGRTFNIPLFSYSVVAIAI